MTASYAGGGEDKIVFITGKNKTTKHWDPKVSTWDTLVEFMREPQTMKECGGYCPVRIKKSESQCITDESDGKRVPHVGLHRSQAAITACSLVTLDADTADPDFVDRIRECGYAGLVHTTFSHNPDEGKYKYRALIRVDRPMDGEEKRLVTNQLMRELGWGQFDTTCASPEHFMYWPSGQQVENDEGEKVFPHYLFEEMDGVLLDVDLYAMVGEVNENPTNENDPMKAVANYDVPPSAAEVWEAQRRLQEAVADLSQQGDGNRNNVLFYKMSRLWPLVLSGCLDEEEMLEQMALAAEACGLPDWEFEHVVEKEKGNALPARPIPMFDVIGEEGGPAGPGGVERENECSWDECDLAPTADSTLCEDHHRAREEGKKRAQATKDALDYDPQNLAAELHIARRIADQYMEPRVRAWGKTGWAIWNGKRWDLGASDDKIQRVLHDAIMDIHAKAEKWARKKFSGDPQGFEDWMKTPNKLFGGAVIGRLGKLVRPYLTVDPALFDGPQTRHLLNCPNGVVDLRTGELSQHRRDYYFTKITRAPYEAGATHADWDQALLALPPDVVPYMQKRFGQACTGMPSPDDVIPFLRGGGANGKSTHVDSIGAALGSFYTHVPKEILIEGRKHDSLLMELKGARWAIIEELPRNRWLDSTSIKDVAGTGIMKSRPLFESYVYWKPTHCIFVTTNFPTQVQETDHGTWRRLERITYPYTFDGAGSDMSTIKGDPGLRQRMDESRDGQREAVLAWLVEGAKRYYAEGLDGSDRPERVRNDTIAWRSEGNPVVAFAEEMLKFSPEDASLSSDVFAVYQEWCKAKGIRASSDQTFWNRMGDTTLMRQPGVEKLNARTLGYRMLSTRPARTQDRMVTGVRIDWAATTGWRNLTTKAAGSSESEAVDLEFIRESLDQQ